MRMILKKKSTCLLSVVTVCLNPGLDLKKTVESIIKQEFNDYELLIKDGCSTDGTSEIKWTDSRIRFLSSPDRGIFDAMNQALALCRGEYVIFMNAGDRFTDSQVLRVFADTITNFPEVDFFYGDVHKNKSRSKINIYPDKLSRFYIFTRMICHQCWCVRRSTYLTYGGFETTYPIGGDSRLYQKMMARDRVKYKHVRKIVAYYEGDGQSTSHPLKKDCLCWEKENKRQIYSSLEYISYSSIWRIWAFIKPFGYDYILCWPWKIIQSLRAL